VYRKEYEAKLRQARSEASQRANFQMFQQVEESSSSSFIIARRPSNIFKHYDMDCITTYYFLLQYTIYTYYKCKQWGKVFCLLNALLARRTQPYARMLHPAGVGIKKNNLNYRNSFGSVLLKEPRHKEKTNGSVAQPVVRPGFYKINALGIFR
jgi:hypothetical protein